MKASLRNRMKPFAVGTGRTRHSNEVFSISSAFPYSMAEEGCGDLEMGLGVEGGRRPFQA